MLSDRGIKLRRRYSGWSTSIIATGVGARQPAAILRFRKGKLVLGGREEWGAVIQLPLMPREPCGLQFPMSLLHSVDVLFRGFRWAQGFYYHFVFTNIHALSSTICRGLISSLRYISRLEISRFYSPPGTQILVLFDSPSKARYRQFLL